MQAIFAAGFRPSALEIADHFTLEAAWRDLGEKIVPPGNAHLLVDLDGQAESVRSESAAIRELIEERKPNAVQMASGEADCEKLWALRRQFSNSFRATGLTKLNEDVVGPHYRVKVSATGATINPALVPGLDQLWGIAPTSLGFRNGP